jgi:hypothetical protein
MTAPNNPHHSFHHSIPRSSLSPRLPVAIPVVSSTIQPDINKSAASPPTTARNTPRAKRAWRGAERAGRRTLLSVSQSLSERDFKVLQAVADHRFLTTRHLERLLFTEHATPLSAARTCRRVLRRLDTLRVVRHLDRRVGGVRAGSASYVWAVGTVGDRLLRLRSGQATRQRQREPSERFLGHALAIADAHLSLIDAHRQQRLDLVSVHTEPACWRRYLGTAGEPAVLQPDLYAVTADADYETLWFLEVDLGNEHLPTLLRKCGQYQAYRTTGAEQETSGTFPIVVWVMSDQQRADRLRAAIQRSVTISADLFRVTTPAALVDLVVGGPV